MHPISFACVAPLHSARLSCEPAVAMSKATGTSLKDAIKQFEAAKGVVAADAEKVRASGCLRVTVHVDRAPCELRRWSSGAECLPSTS